MGDNPQTLSVKKFVTKIRFNNSINLFDHSYESLFLHSNGFVTFQQRDSNGIFPPHLKNLEIPAIAPYWTDFDIKMDGTVSYSVIKNENIIFDISKHIKNYCSYQFKPIFTFIVTLNQIFYVYNHNTHKSFQLVITKNNCETFIIFTYGILKKDQFIKTCIGYTD